MEAFMNAYAVVMVLILPAAIITPLALSVWEYFSNRAADKRWEKKRAQRLEGKRHAS